MRWRVEIQHKKARVLLTDPKRWIPGFDWWHIQRILWTTTYFKISSDGKELGFYLSKELKVRIVRDAST